MLDYFALGLLIFVALVIFYGVIIIHDNPYEIAKKGSTLIRMLFMLQGGSACLHCRYSGHFCGFGQLSIVRTVAGGLTTQVRKVTMTDIP